MKKMILVLVMSMVGVISSFGLDIETGLITGFEVGMDLEDYYKVSPNNRQLKVSQTVGYRFGALDLIANTYLELYPYMTVETDTTDLNANTELEAIIRLGDFTISYNVDLFSMNGNIEPNEGNLSIKFFRVIKN